MPDLTDRADTAFRAAFAAHDPGEVSPLDPDAVRALGASQGSGARASGVGRARRSTRWLAAAAAVVVVGLAVPLGMLLTRPAPTTAVQAPVADAGAAPPPGEVTTPAPLEPGFRYASMGDVVVQVPQGWGYASALGPDWCVGDQPDVRRPSDPTTPFVDVRPESRPVLAVLCPGDVPAARQTMHLTWRHGNVPAAAPADPTPGWVRVQRSVGSLMLTVVAPTSERGLADRILATARRVGVDAHGCPVSAPTALRAPGPAVGPGKIADGPVVVCQYDDLPRGGANLVGSRRLSPLAATPLLRLLAETEPAGATCRPDDRPASLVVLRFASGQEVWLKAAGCAGSVIDDSGPERAASAAVCATVFTAPLGVSDAAASDACAAGAAAVRTGASAGEGVPHELLTHCGVNEAAFGGRWFVRVGGPLDDGHGNAPSGWAQPIQPGRLAVTGAVAVFTDAAGHRETFVEREGAGGPLVGCA